MIENYDPMALAWGIGAFIVAVVIFLWDINRRDK
ncbi:hypothetical protein bas08_0074 [Escherichia phage DanielBernoulli]|uniref:Uncharacterized protein n=1 Tax=Escherichia phage DanielBernoulli TaxID=2851972 RepID=A0AAE7VQG2_9CAUD|nr:hypothetical protein bas08_0074 [Escherichia phage DanielBernoulli]